MRKALPFRLLGWFSAYVPEPFQYVLLWLLSAGPFLWFWPGMNSYLRRIRAFQGRKTSFWKINRMVLQTLDVYVRTTMTLCFSCGPDSYGRTLRPVNLELLPSLTKLLKRGKGVILAMPHFGDRYAAISALTLADIPLTVVVVGGQDFKWGEAKKTRFAPLRGGASACLAALARNETVLLYGDLDFFPGNRTSDFFGAPYFPPHGLARMALASEAAILPCYSVSKPRSVELLGDAPILPEDGMTQERMEDELLRSMERFLGRFPEQWQVFDDPWDLALVKKRTARLLRGPRA